MTVFLPRAWVPVYGAIEVDGQPARCYHLRLRLNRARYAGEERELRIAIPTLYLSGVFGVMKLTRRSPLLPLRFLLTLILVGRFVLRCCSARGAGSLPFLN